MDLLKGKSDKAKEKTANWKTRHWREVPRMQQRPGGTHGTGPGSRVALTRKVDGQMT